MDPSIVLFATDIYDSKPQLKWVVFPSNSTDFIKRVEGRTYLIFPCVYQHASFGFSVDGRIITSFTRKCSNCSSPYCREVFVLCETTYLMLYAIIISRHCTRQNYENHLCSVVNLVVAIRVLVMNCPSLLEFDPITIKCKICRTNLLWRCNRLIHNLMYGFCRQAEMTTQFNYLKSVATIHH